MTFTRAVVRLLMGAAAVAGAACSSASSAGSESSDAAAGVLTGAIMPWSAGNTWTYRVTDDGNVTTKVTTLGAAPEPVGGAGPHRDALAFQVVTKKGDDGTDQTISWQAQVGDDVVRYREQSFSASTGALTLEEHWDPYKLHIGGSAEHRVTGAAWVEDYTETKLPVTGEHETAEQRDAWTVESARESVIVPAGTFDAIVFRKVGGSSLKTYWYTPGIGKIKETGGQTEELVSYQVAP